MATIALTSNVQEDNTLQAVWAGGTNADNSVPVEVSRYRSAAFQHLSGTLGTTTVQGSNDGVAWGAIGAGVTLAAANAVSIITSLPRFVRIAYGAAAAGAVVTMSATR